MLAAAGPSAAALVPLALFGVAFVVFCLTDIVRSPVRGLPKWAWALICVISVPLGGILYLVVGRGAETVVPPPPSTPVPPAPPPPRPVSGVAVRTDGLRKLFGSHAALAGVDLEVRGGTVYGLAGPNGAGKTTLIGVLAGLRRKTSGSVELSAERPAVMPDTPEFEPWLTASEVVDLSRTLAASETGSERVQDVLAEAGLLEVADRRVGGFSRGMTQRLGLAATVVADPDLLLLDEPCSALDPAGRRDVLDLVVRLGRRSTVLFSSHILADIERVCDSVGILRSGELLYQGSLEELLNGRLAPAFVVRVRPPGAPVAAALRREAFVERVEQVAGELRVTVRSRAEAERDLPRALADAGAAVMSLEPVAHDLESAFLDLMGETPPRPDREAEP